MSVSPAGGVSAEAIRTFDWASTPLGPRESWPALLRTMLPVVLASAGPKLLLWGPELITFHNDAYLPLLGSIGCGIGRPFPELRADIWPHTGPYIEAALAGTGKLLQNNEGVTWRNGYAETVYVTLCYSPLVDEEGRTHGVLAEIYDMSRELFARDQLRDENERLYRLFGDAPFIMAYATVPDYRIQYANPAFSAFYGDRPLVGRTVAEALPEAAEQGFIPLLESVVASGEPLVGRNVEVLVQNEAGAPPIRRFVDFVYQPALNGRQEVTGLFCFGYEVTEHQLSRERAEQLHTQLLHTSRVNAMGTMAMTLAHELNQPLTAAANFLAAARRFTARSDFGEDVTSALTHSEGQIQRAGEIIRRVRNMVAAGAPKRETVQVEGAIARSIDLLRVSEETEGVGVDVQVRAGAERVVADQVQLEQILVNLLRNAADAIDGHDAARIAIEAARDGDMVRVSVRDQGTGIEASRAETLFEALQPSSRGGLGVGLSLCRTMVEAHGGRIWAESEVGTGTAISFTLPAAEEPRARY